MLTILKNEGANDFLEKKSGLTLFFMFVKWVADAKLIKFCDVYFWSKCKIEGAIATYLMEKVFTKDSVSKVEPNLFCTGFA